MSAPDSIVTDKGRLLSSLVLVGLTCLLSCADARAQPTPNPSLTSKTFKYEPGPITGFDPSAFEWNPLSVATTPFMLSFYGTPDPSSPCGAKGIPFDQPVAANPRWANSAPVTGINDGPEKWTPQCGERQGLTFGRVSPLPAQAGGGIGLYTHSGPQPSANDRSRAFFRPYGPSGDQNGSNKHIQGSFASFQYFPWSQTLMMPWSGNPANGPLRTAIVFEQTMPVARVGGANTQVQQKIHIKFFAKTSSGCNPSDSPAYCQLEVILYSGLVEGSGAYGEHALLFTDPSQGGLPVIIGPIPSTGQTIQIGCPGRCTDAWTSWANPTQRSAFPGQKKFQVEISFSQFQNLLRAVAAGRAKAKGINETSALQQLYGARYGDPQTWALFGVVFAQEVYNPYPDRTVAVGGALKSAEVIALPF